MKPFFRSVSVFGIGLAALFFLGGSFNQAHAAFSYRRPITATSSATAIPAAQSDFPALVDLTLSSLKSSGNGGHMQNSNGYDVGFYSNSNCLTGKINYERENYVSSTGEFEAWVPITTLNTSTVIYMCYGDSSVSADPSSSTAPWDSNYKAVYHLGNGTALNASDSTSNANNGTLSGTPPTATTSGQIDGAANFNQNSYITLPTSSINTALNSASWTISTWIYSPHIYDGTDGMIFGSKGNTNSRNISDCCGWGAYIDIAEENIAVIQGTIGTPAPNAWNQIVWTQNGSAWSVYINNSVSATGTYSFSGSFAGNYYISGISNSWNGSIDEVRVSSVARSANWLTSDYWTQFATGTAGFWSVGAEQAVGGGSAHPSVKLRGGGAVAGGNGGSSNWKYYRVVTATSSATAIPSAQSDFPALIDVTLASLKTTGNGGNVQNANGYDIGFGTEKTCNSGKINYERENYVSSTGEFEAWVPITTLNTSTVIYMCYGDSSVSADPSSSTAPWDGNYEGVWHQSENVANTTVNDSTSKGNTGTSVRNTNVIATSGKIDGGFVYDGSSDDINVGSSTSLQPTSTLTLEIWMYKNNTSTQGALITQGNTSFNGKGYDMFAYNDGIMYWDLGNRITHAYSPAVWQYWVGSIDNSAQNLYLNGVLVASTTAVGFSYDTTSSTFIGFWQGSGMNFGGVLDEARISNIARSANWLTSDYWTQFATGTAGFWSVGAEQKSSSLGSSVKLRGGGGHGVKLR